MRELSAFKMAPPLAHSTAAKAAPPPEPSMAELPYTGQDIANLAWGLANAVRGHRI